MYKTKAYSAASATTPLARTTIPRREPTPRDVQIEILYCGICHSDLHYARNEWSSLMQTVYDKGIEDKHTPPPGEDNRNGPQESRRAVSKSPINSESN